MDYTNRPHPIVFILDDEPGIIRLCQRLLERAGFDYLSFINPVDALVALEEKPVDILLVDIRMPGIDGFQVIDQARQLHPDLAVVAMTGYGTVETAIETLRRGADELVLKPFNSNELVHSVQRALEQRQHKQDQMHLQALRPLFDISEALFTETNPKRLQNLILSAVCGHLRCSHAEYYQVSMPDTDEPNNKELLSTGGDPTIEKSSTAKPGRMRLAGSLHYPDRKVQPYVRPVTTHFTEPIARKANQLRVPLLIQVDGPGSPASENQLKDMLASRGLGSMLCAQVPVKAGAGTGGVLIAARDQDEPRFRQADLEMFILLARQAAVAFENARLHTELRAYINQLEDSQRALIQAEKMAIAGRLTASIAHEINNPLQAVQNCLHLAGRQKLPASQRQNYLEMARSELDRLMLTVQRMLDFYRPVALDRKPVDLNEIMKNVLSLLEKQLSDNHITIQYNPTPNLPLVMAVSDQIQQVILNLILNAVEAMPGGGIIHIETSINSTNPNEVEMFFEDTGIGVSPDQRKHIFEPFSSTKAGGIGLGLTVSYGIITAHGGSLDLVDRRILSPRQGTNRGACFRVTLPIVEHT